MFNIGTGEMMLICVVALLILGPKRLPEMARSMGRFWRSFQRQTHSIRNRVEREFLRMDVEEENKTALDAMASSAPVENPPLSPAPVFLKTTPAATTPYTPSALADASPSSPADAPTDPYGLALAQADTEEISTPSLAEPSEEVSEELPGGGGAEP